MPHGRIQQDNTTKTLKHFHITNNVVFFLSVVLDSQVSLCPSAAAWFGVQQNQAAELHSPPNNHDSLSALVESQTHPKLDVFFGWLS